MSLVNIPLMQNCVDLWVISLPINFDLLLTLKSNLNLQELNDLELFKNSILKDNATVSRGALRSILSKYLEIEPRLINIEINPFGKPYIPGSNISFNLSHAGKYILICISTDVNLGVDIEQILNDFDYSDIVENYFTHNEKLSINSKSITGRKMFYRAWTRKEACLKAVGKGLSIDLKDIEVTCADDQPAMVVKFKDFANDWQLFEIDLDSEYMVSLALQSSHSYSINDLEFI